MNKFMKFVSVVVEVDREKKDKVRYVVLQFIYLIFNRVLVLLLNFGENLFFYIYIFRK